MSSAQTKRPLNQARADAEAFMELFPQTSYVRWTIAGSVRRGKAEVGDIEHVVEPAFGEVPTGDMFGGTERRNLLWAALDAMIANGTLAKHVYHTAVGDQSRWGDSYRGVDFRGFNNEIFTATPNNYGAILLIRTGPADYSKNFVDRFLRGHLYRQQGGNLVHIKSGGIVPIPDEETYFKMAGLPYVHPGKR